MLRLTSSLFLHSSFFFGPLEMIGSMHVCSLLAKIHILLKDESLRKISDTFQLIFSLDCDHQNFTKRIDLFQHYYLATVDRGKTLQTFWQKLFNKSLNEYEIIRNIQF